MIPSPEKKILDVTCGSRTIWFDKHHPAALYCDNRQEYETRIWKSRDGTAERVCTVNPDVLCDFTDLPFPDESFSVVVWDPPHRHGKNKRGYTRTHKKGARASAGTSIEERPEEVNTRATIGHWEMDSVLGKKRTKPALLVLSERYSRKEIIIKVKDHTAASAVRSLDRLERKMGSPAFRSVFQSITVDNGSEFADAAGMEQSCRSQGQRTKVYYCHPYSSWERGTNENTNGLIRRWFPKGTDFTKVTTQEIQKVED